MMVWKWMQRHRWLRCALCLLLAVLISMSPMVKALVVAHAVAVTTSGIILTVGTILAALGITFASVNEMNRVCLSFYNKSSSAVKQWVDGQVLQFPGPEPGGDPNKGGGWGAILNIPSTIMVTVAAFAASFFAKDKPPEVEDTSWQNGLSPADNWRNFVGKPMSEYVHPEGLYSGLPFPVMINRPFSPSTISPGYSWVPFELSSPLLQEFTWRTWSMGWGSVYYKSASPAVLTDNENAVLRFYNPLGETLDYQLRVNLASEVVSSSVYNLFYVDILESVSGAPFVKNSYLLRTSSSSKWPGNRIPYELGVYAYLNNNQLQLGFLTKTIDHLNELRTDDLVSGLISNIAISGSCILGGVFDKVTGKPIDTTAAYIPSVLSQNIGTLVTAALDDWFKNNPGVLEFPLQVPQSAPDLAAAPWQDIPISPEYVTDLEERIKKLEEDPPPVNPPPIDPEEPIKPPTLVPPTGMYSMFPFCIPFDMALAFNCFVAEPVAPVFEIPFKYGNIVDEKITLDLSQWDFVLSIIRWGELIVYTVGLAVVTRNFIKW